MAFSLIMSSSSVVDQHLIKVAVGNFLIRFLLISVLNQTIFKTGNFGI